MIGAFGSFKMVLWFPGVVSITKGWATTSDHRSKDRGGRNESSSAAIKTVGPL